MRLFSPSPSAYGRTGRWRPKVARVEELEAGFLGFGDTREEMRNVVKATLGEARIGVVLSVFLLFFVIFIFVVVVFIWNIVLILFIIGDF